MPDSDNHLSDYEKNLVAEIADMSKKLSQIQVRSVYQLIGTDFVRNFMSEYNTSANLAVKAYMSLLDSLPKYVDLIQPLLRAKIEFREQQVKFIQSAYQSTSIIMRQLIVEWSKISLKIHADLANLRFNFECTQESYKQTEQVVINLKDGKTETGLIEYQEIEHEGQKYQILFVPKAKYKEFRNQYVSLSVDYGDKKLFIGSLTNQTIDIDELKLVYEYDSITKTIRLGPYLHSLINNDLSGPKKE